MENDMDHGFDKIYNLFESIIAGDLPSKLDMWELGKLESQYLSEKDQRARNEIYANICSYLTFIDKSEIGNELAREVILFLATGEKKPKPSKNDVRLSAVLPLMNQISRKFHIDAWRLFGMQRPVSEEEKEQPKSQTEEEKKEAERLARVKEHEKEKAKEERHKRELSSRVAAIDKAKQSVDNEFSKIPDGEPGKENPMDPQEFDVYDALRKIENKKSRRKAPRLSDMFFSNIRNREMDKEIGSRLGKWTESTSYDTNDAIWNALMEFAEYRRWKMRVDD